MTTNAIELPPMSDEEGSSLIRHHLKRGGSEKESAAELSRALGGHPLAIAHFAGYVAQSQCTIDQILDSYHKRANSSRIWSCTDLASVGFYSRTLDTVWDLAFQRLTPDARNILNIVAFLEADRIPEEMFVGGPGPKLDGDWKFWNIHRCVQDFYCLE